MPQEPGFDPLSVMDWGQPPAGRARRAAESERDAGLQRIRRATKWIAALSLAGATVASAALAHAFPGRSNASSRAGSNTSGQSSAGSSGPSSGQGQSSPSNQPGSGGFGPGSGFGPVAPPSSAGGRGLITSGGS
jgi:hypothetical protein